MLRASALSLVLVLLVGCSDAGGRRPTPDAPRRAPTVETKIRAVTLDARRPPEPELLESLRALGVTHIALVTFGFQPGYRVPQIRLHNEGGWYSESDRGIRQLAARARSLGMRLILKPHVWVGDYHEDGQQRHSIGFDSESEWQRWEADYRALLMHYATLSEAIDAPILVVGTELAGTVQSRAPFWRRLIADVRRVYHGKLTYAANWWQEYEAVPFWDALDYIGVQAYFELTDRDDPSPAVLREAWAVHREALARLSSRTGRPVLFTEIGYRAVPYAAAEPWRWPVRNEADHTRPDVDLQARLYEAFFESLWHEPWFAGAILWKWRPSADLARERRRLGFSPQDSPAEDVVARWFRADAALDPRAERPRVE